MNAKFIEELNARVVSFLQQTPAAEISQNMKAALTASFSKLDLVTREEFDIQAQVLAKTRAKLEALVDDLIDLGRVEAGHLELAMARVSLDAVINESLSLVAPLAECREAVERLAIGLDAVARLARFSPFIFGDSFTAADCAAYVHFTMINIATTTIYGVNMLDRHVPGAARYMAMMDERPHIRTMMAQRADAMTAFIATNVPYDG